MKEFNPDIIKGSRYFHEFNGDSKFPDFVEGYWRTSLDVKDELPFPIPWAVKGFNKTEFLIALREVQESAKLERYRGLSLNRWTRKAAGSAEYTKDGWTWPYAYGWYVERGVPPSKEFFRFITGKTCESLPSYGRGSSHIKLEVVVFKREDYFDAAELTNHVLKYMNDIQDGTCGPNIIYDGVLYWSKARVNEWLVRTGYYKEND